MCGIIAYIGNQQAYPIIIKGLQRLEYRGYDSAGVAPTLELGFRKTSATSNATMDQVFVEDPAKIAFMQLLREYRFSKYQTGKLWMTSQIQYKR